MVPWMGVPAAFPAPRFRAGLRIEQQAKASAKKFPRTYCTARSTRGLSFGERTRAASVANPQCCA